LERLTFFSAKKAPSFVILAGNFAQEDIALMENEEPKVEQVEEPKEEVKAEQKLEAERTVPEFPSGQGKKKRKAILFGTIAAVVVLAGAFLYYFLFLGSPTRQVLATVNGEKITVEEFNKEVAKVEEPLRDMYKEEPDKFLEGVIIKILLTQEAKKQGVSMPAKTYKDTATDKDKNTASLSPEELLIAELMKKKFSTPPAVTRQEIETFYTMFKDRMGGKPLNEVAPVLEQIIQQGKQQQELEEFVKKLRVDAKVEIAQDRLKKMAAKPPESNTDEEFKKALGAGKPVLVDFGANSCPPCRQMRPVLKEVGTEYSDKAKVLVIDVYKFKALASEYKVQMIPTLVFFDSKGKEVFRHVGVLEKEKIVAKFKEIGTGT
jgi:thioredoxin 1